MAGRVSRGEERERETALGQSHLGPGGTSRFKLLHRFKNSLLTRRVLWIYTPPLRHSLYRCFLNFFPLVLMKTRAGHLTPFIGSTELTFRTQRERSASINTQRSQESVFYVFYLFIFISSPFGLLNTTQTLTIRRSTKKRKLISNHHKVFSIFYVT